MNIIASQVEYIGNRSKSLDHDVDDPPLVASCAKFTRAEVSQHDQSHSCWTIINNRVYDVTLFIKEVSATGGFSEQTLQMV